MAKAKSEPNKNIHFNVFIYSEDTIIKVISQANY
jgi:hypothetical protein